MIAQSNYPAPVGNVAAFVAQPVYRRWRQISRDILYTEVGRGQLVLAGDADYTTVVILRGSDGRFWVRPEWEFSDHDRFEEVPGSVVDQKVLALIQQVYSAGGDVDASGSPPKTLLDHFCEDRIGSEDTFNIAVNAGLLHVVRSNPDPDSCIARLTAKGQDLFNIYQD